MYPSGYYPTGYYSRAYYPPPGGGGSVSVATNGGGYYPSPHYGRGYFPATYYPLDALPVFSGSSGGGRILASRALPPYESCTKAITTLVAKKKKTEKQLNRLLKRVDTDQEKLRYEESMKLVKALMLDLTKAQDEINNLYIKLAEIEPDEMEMLSVCINAYYQ